MTETREGLTTYSALTSGKRVLPWESIERFESMPGTRGRVVAAVSKTGRRTTITGLDAKDEMTWREGEQEGDFDDLIAELNARLAGWRALVEGQPIAGD